MINKNIPSILFVDDEEIIRKSFTRELQMERFAVTTVASGNEALNALEDRQYDLVITDLMMPDINGFDVLKAAKKLAHLTSVIILTGHGDMQSAIEALRLGADDFVRKPCEIEELVFRIRNCLERKQAEEALRGEQKRLADIIDFLPDATLAIDTDGRVIIWNKAIEKITGISAKDMIGKGSYAYAIPFFGEARPMLIDIISAGNEEIATKYPCATREDDALVSRMFCKHCSNEGAWYFAKASPLRDQFGNIIGAIESIRNITDIRQAEEDLRKAAARFGALLNATEDSVILVQPDGVILDLNENAARRRNVTQSLMRGNSLFDFLPPETAALRHKAITDVMTERRLVQYDETRYDKRYRIRLFPVLDDQGDVNQVASFSKDITDQI